MASSAELCSSPAPLTSVQVRSLTGKSSQLFSSQNALYRDVRSSHWCSLHVGLKPLCYSMTLAVTDELAPVSPLRDSDVSEDGSREFRSNQSELKIDEVEYIDRLAAEIQECSQTKDLATGEEVHAHIIDCGLESDRYLGNLLVLMYGNCGSIKAAEVVFHKIPSPNIYSGNMMINAYVSNNEVDKASAFFDDMPQRNAASWNAIISALAKTGYGKDALKYYHGMLEEGFQPNVITCVSAIDACADAAALSEGMKLHSAVIASGFYDIIVGTALINMYGQCGSLDSARDIFRRFPQHDVFSWSAMIAACVNNACSEEALQMFDQMPSRSLKPSRSTYLSVLNACGNLTALTKGYEVHAQMLSVDVEADIRVGNALINMYGRCRRIHDSTTMFHRMEGRNIITWSTMIASYSENGKHEEALELFYRMQAECVNPNNYTISIVFDVCTSLEAHEEGQCVYDYSVCVGIELDFIAAIALINMYGKCGSLEDAKLVFRRFEKHGVLVWNAMISAYVRNGHYKEGLALLEEMQSKGVKPSKATFKIFEDNKTPDSV